ncbi:uncharacterized protein TRAVEDRAFT_43886 [Trametes versicolor FP-101664 SS1]|uniref:uncharacterized protein n=1 Tax=Trametes versicolor (strain FP-101664) TaxID=717944 RepID=UPI000462125C|nr:uncharacterized protein TRAVEDRAFT_43886 [Trametes versicolor FP-101664 SS1]EIW63600.1 hypothetical protein TRAVEDRAFT_43886 [Trametes versicolor FP-101664 SS1]
MQSYSNPDVFFCPLYNLPGVSDPISTLLSNESEHRTPSAFSTPTTSRSGSPFSAASPNSTPPTSPETWPSRPPKTPSSASSPTAPEASKKLQKYRRMCAKSGTPLLDLVAEVENRRMVHEKRKQVSFSDPARLAPV